MSFSKKSILLILLHILLNISLIYFIFSVLNSSSKLFSVSFKQILIVKGKIDLPSEKLTT